jgi:hypothetical protein
MVYRTPHGVCSIKLFTTKFLPYNNKLECFPSHSLSVANGLAYYANGLNFKSKLTSGVVL